MASVLQDVVHLQITSLWQSHPIRYSQKHMQHGVPISEEIHYSNEVNGVHTAALCTRTYEHHNRSELERPWSLTVGRLQVDSELSFRIPLDPLTDQLPTLPKLDFGKNCSRVQW